MKFTLSSAHRRDLYLCLGVLIVCGLLCLIEPPVPLLSQKGKVVPGRVMSVDNSGITKHGLVQYGGQSLTVKVDGKTVPGYNELRGQMELDKLFVKGDLVQVVVPEDGIKDTTAPLVVRDHYRNYWNIALFGGFCVLLCVFGSVTGIKALLSFVFSCLVIWRLVIPLVLKGVAPGLLIFGAVTILTAVIIFLVAGLNRKGVAAFTGAVSGVFAGLFFAMLAGKFMHINGASLPYAQVLCYNGFEFLDLGDLFTGGMILSCSGAVMDLAMDIASGVEEVHLHNKDLTAKELTLSGIRIGRSVVGTMTTTLLLAYSGGYMTLLMMFTVQGTPPGEFFSSNIMAPELVKTLIGSFSLVLVAPFTALIAGFLFGRKKDGPDCGGMSCSGNENDRSLHK